MLELVYPADAAVPRLFVRNVMLEAPQVVLVIVFLAAMLAIAVEDWRRFRVPDRLVLIASLAGLWAEWLTAGAFGEDRLAALLLALLNGAVSGGALLLLREAYFQLRGIEGIGLGDIKLAVAGGIWLGSMGFAVALFYASLLGLGFILSQRLWRGPPSALQKLPFATFIAPMVAAVWLFP